MDINNLSNKDQLNFFKAIFKVMQEPYFVRDVKGNIIIWPESITNLTGYTAEDVKGMKSSDVLKGGVSLSANDVVKDKEIVITSKSGEKIPVLVSVAPYSDSRGSIKGIAEILKDNRVYKSLIRSLDLSIRESTERLSSVSDELATSTTDVEQIASHLKEQSENVNYESKNAVNSASDVKDKIKTCNEVASSFAKNIDLIDTSMDSSVRKIEDLKDKSNVIIAIVKTIQEIATQTNLLALNASIEAARAGNAGKSFSVVAGEIKKLAINTGVSASEINESVSSILSAIEETVNMMVKTRQELAEGFSKTQNLFSLISEINDASDYMMKIIQKISQTSDKSAAMSGEQLSSMNEIAKVSTHLAEVTQELSRAINNVIQKL